MLANPAPAREPAIGDHARAQQYIRDWFRRYQRNNWKVRRCDVSFHQRILSCVVTVRFSHLVPYLSSYRQEDNHQQFIYDLSKGITEGTLGNQCLMMIEPYEAWTDRSTRWKEMT